MTVLNFFDREVLAHRDHPTLRRFDSAMELSIGFLCRCTRPAFNIRTTLGMIRQSSPEVRELLTACRREDPLDLYGRKRSKRETFLAERRASALLHSMLTKEQRWSLRATDSFLVRGQDGNTYQVRRNATVLRLEEGHPVTSYCIHPVDPLLPAADVMIAQMLILRSDIRHFLATANARAA